MSKPKWLAAAALLVLTGSDALAQFAPPATAVPPRVYRPRVNRAPRGYTAVPRRPRRRRRGTVPRVVTSPMPSYNPPFYYTP